MRYSRILTIQDISCVGQCSMTVALPILSACGQETCILPSAVLSTHTGGFSFPAIRDLTDDLPGIQKHWQKEGITFDAIYTGYLGSTKQIAYVEDILATMTRNGGKTIVDPAMADNGKLYTGFDAAYVDAMGKLCAKADVVLPNLTEACFLTGTAYREDMHEQEILAVVDRLHEMGCGCVVLTGAGATYPYGKDPDDKNIRIAPSFPTPEEMLEASKVFALCVKLASVEKLLAEMA